MIKATTKGKDGRDVLVIGLSFANLKNFRDYPRDSYIKISGAEIGLPVDVTIFSGESEAAMLRLMAEFIGPDTKVNIDPRNTDA